ncbi:hypothetical protein EU527_13080, partial [Candidatus Thorarchaeota archaeon]
MKRKFSLVAIIVTVILVSGFISSGKVAFTNTLGPYDRTNPAGIIIESLIPNPDHDQEPDVFINGTSNEFSSSY